MGNFSYICKKCKTSIRQPERCIIFLLDKGEIVEWQIGRYTGYGAVEEARTGYDDCDGDTWKYAKWSTLVNMHFNDDDTTGFAVYHEKCYTGQIPIKISDDDSEQGWGLPRNKFIIEKKIDLHKLPLKTRKILCAARL